MVVRGGGGGGDADNWDMIVETGDTPNWPIIWSNIQMNGSFSTNGRRIHIRTHWEITSFIKAVSVVWLMQSFSFRLINWLYQLIPINNWTQKYEIRKKMSLRNDDECKCNWIVTVIASARTNRMYVPFVTTETEVLFDRMDAPFKRCKMNKKESSIVCVCVCVFVWMQAEMEADSNVVCKCKCQWWVGMDWKRNWNGTQTGSHSLTLGLTLIHHSFSLRSSCVAELCFQMFGPSYLPLYSAHWHCHIKRSCH